jgi:competence CoiA-like predicted nuclease
MGAERYLTLQRKNEANANAAPVTGWGRRNEMNLSYLPVTFSPPKRGGHMAGDLLLAVSDGPAGADRVDMPADRHEAIRLRERHSNRFWCSTEASGCGGGLMIAAGPVLRPHFRHRRDARCSFIGSESKAGPAYEHLRYQRALLRWLESQGHLPVLEKTLGPDGRTDLHVVVDAVRHSIEVQLSPLPANAWRERDAKYRRHHDHVTWLYGPSAEAAGATELSLRGVSFSLRPGPHLGVQDVDQQTHWVELIECQLTPDGLFVPGVEQARALHRRREADANNAARQAAAEEATEQRRTDAQRAEWERRSAAARDERQRRQDQQRPEQRIFTLNHDPSLRGLERFEGLWPESLVWTPEVGWGWLDRLPEELHRPARALAYTTQVLAASAPTSNLLKGVLTDDERGQILDVLQELGLIKLVWPLPDLERFERTRP